MATTPDSRFDVVTIGRIGIDVYPLQDGVGLEDVETFGKYLGGSATNVAIAAARHGLRTAVITATGDDPFGRFAHRELTRLGVDDRFVAKTTETRTGAPRKEAQLFEHSEMCIFVFWGAVGALLPFSQKS